jgi:RNA polymerase sigma-70 factor (ECF subfamily)
MLRKTPDEAKQEFQEVALPHAESLYNFAFRMTRNRRDAEDLVQDTLMRAFRFFHRFESGTNIRAWLFRILKNTYINTYRKVQRTPDQVDWAQVEDFYDSITPDDLRKRHKNPEELLLEKSVDGRVEEAVAALPTEYRAVVLLNFMEDMSYKEIAEILEIPMGTVMSRLHRGRKILQHKLRDYAASTNLLPSHKEDGDAATSGRVVPMDAYRRRAAGE